MVVCEFIAIFFVAFWLNANRQVFFEFLAKVLGHWSFVAVIALLVFRKNIISLLQKKIRLKYGGNMILIGAASTEDIKERRVEEDPQSISEATPPMEMENAISEKPSDESKSQPQTIPVRINFREIESKVMEAVRAYTKIPFLPEQRVMIKNLKVFFDGISIEEDKFTAVEIIFCQSIINLQKLDSKAVRFATIKKELGENIKCILWFVFVHPSMLAITKKELFMERCISLTQTLNIDIRPLFYEDGHLKTEPQFIVG